MKNTLFTLLLILVGFTCTNAVEIPDSLLTDAQRTLVEQKNTQQTVSGWIGLGKEIGTAVDESMKAITDRSNDFANTPVGKLTVFIVIYKVMGPTISAIATSFVAFILFVPWIVYTTRKYNKETNEVKLVWLFVTIISFIISTVIILYNISQIA